jgi:hypothetical protein
LIVKLRGSAFFNTRQPKVFQMTRLLWHLVDFFNSINCTMKHNYGKKKGCGAAHFNSCYNCITWTLILLSYSLIYVLSITAHFLSQKGWIWPMGLDLFSLTSPSSLIRNFGTVNRKTTKLLLKEIYLFRTTLT